MKKILLLAGGAIMLCYLSCNNKQSGTIATTQKIDSVAIDSIRLDSIFENKGDTIFANVLYGMSRIDADQSIKAFEKTLKHPDPRMDGFVFGTIHFMNH